MHRHKLQEEVFIAVRGNGTIILDGKHVPMPEGTIVRVGPSVYRAIGNDSGRDVVYMIFRRHSAEELFPRRQYAFWRRYSQPEKGAGLEKRVVVEKTGRESPGKRYTAWAGHRA